MCAEYSERLHHDNTCSSADTVKHSQRALVSDIFSVPVMRYTITHLDEDSEKARQDNESLKHIRPNDGSHSTLRKPKPQKLIFNCSVLFCK